MQRNGIEKENEGIRDWKLMSLGPNANMLHFFKSFIFSLFLVINTGNQVS